MGLKGLVVVVVKNSISSTPLLLAVSHSNRRKPLVIWREK
jgi:hypothetical protein